MKKLNILIVSHSFPPFMNVGGMRAYSWAKYWSEAGHNITVITSKARSEFSYTATFKIEIPKNVEVIEIENPLFKYFNKGSGLEKKGKIELNNQAGWFKKKVGNIFNIIKNNAPVVDYYFDWYFKSVLYIKKNKKSFSNFDIVISTANPLSAHSIGMYLKKKFGVKWIADYRDLEEQSKMNDDISWLRRKFITSFKKRALALSDLDITVSKGLKDILLSVRSEDKVEIIYNGFFEENYFEKEEKEGSLDWKIIYTGTFYKNDFVIKPLFDALRLIEDSNIPIPDIQFYGIGDPSMKEFIRTQAKLSLRKKINFYDSVSNKEIAEIQMNSAMLLLMDGINNKGVLKTKSYEYLAAQRPIIAIINPESELAQNFLLGLNGYYVGTDVNEIKNFIEKIYNAVIEEKKISSLSFFEEEKLNYYSRKSQALNLIEQMKKLENT
ncbi:glycosyltransferase family 4 protein [Sporosarcina sp. E16_3]|uniref:glycosyltransferase family 4 protein n=1 Tax=Sporosarcina sp. E16_3 TaxID=2789293 RepID=UPI001A90D9D5|nr:glycosyltransferase family 4 protein [Sporosarcina sp. E16_3]MBO0602545.1 glycosyltransferase family 4 protein [Sporosarcina sp. E16_3]